MNWKEFLKPNKEKAIGFVILFLASIALHSLYLNCPPTLEPSHCTNWLSFIGLVFEWPGLVAASFFGQTAFFNYVFFSVDIIYSYLLSCLIVFTVKKAKK